MSLKVQNRVGVIVLTGMCTAIICVLSIISIPLPSGVPITLQTFAVALCSYILGIKLAPVSVFTYLVIGSVGIPVFSGFTSGVGRLAGVTGGFLWGFLLFAVICGVGMLFKNKVMHIAFGILGLAVCHVCGLIQFSVVANVSLGSAFATATLPYILKDVVSVIAAYFLSRAVLSALKKAKLTTN